MSNLYSCMRATAGAVLLGMSIMALPAIAAAEDHRLDEAWKAALQDLEGVMTEKEHALANSVAYHSAAARLCDGIDLDVEKVGVAMNTIAEPANRDLTDDQRMERITNILLTLGTAKGIFLAEGALQKDQFCKDAMAAKADPENQHYWK